MPSTPKTLLIALTALASFPASLAAPPGVTSSSSSSSSHNPSASSPFSAPHLSTRADYHPSTPSDDRSDYCGEAATPGYWFGDGAPLAADCTAVYEGNPGPGYWAVSAAETEAARGRVSGSGSGSGSDGWVRLAQAGTCAFEVRLERAQQEVVGLRFGTNDLQFYIRSNVVREARDGRVGTAATVACFNGEKVVGVEWRVVHS